jgi:MFS family permease
VFANPGLRRLQLAYATSMTGWWIFFVALPVYTYEHDGAVAVGLVAGVRLGVAAIAAPFASLLGDRHDRALVMLSSDLVRAAALAVTTVVALADAPSLVVYALAVLVTVASTAFHPAQAALLPTLARTPDELTAANVTNATIINVSGFVGPAVGGLLIALVGVDAVFGVTAVTMVWSAWLIARLRRVPGAAASPEPAVPGDPAAAAVERGGFLREAVAGFGLIGRDRRLRVLVALQGLVGLTAGTLNVFVVVLALDELELGDAGVGYLNAAISVGGVLGALGAAALIGGSRLAAGYAIGVVLWGVPLLLIGLEPSLVAALVLLAVLGVGDSLTEVAGLTLLQRAVPDEVLARVFGVLETLAVATIGLGSVLAPALVSGLGLQAALVVTGAALPLVMLLAWRPLRAVDRDAAPRTRELELLRGSSIFAPLPLPTLTQLAGRLEPVEVAAGTEVVRQGEAGDRFYLIDHGVLEARVDDEVRRRLEAGAFFGEIALLRDTPRTATVAVVEDARLLALERDEFIAAVTGHAPSHDAADAVVTARLAAVGPDLGVR